MDHSPAYLLHKFLFELDRAADKLLQTQVGISYNRALFLLVLQSLGTVTQHALAVALGYSDPAISVMLLELSKEGYVQTAISPEHKRKRLVTITPQGSEVVAKAKRLLDMHFDQLMIAAGVDAKSYGELTEQLYQTLMARINVEQS